MPHYAGSRRLVLRKYGRKFGRRVNFWKAFRKTNKKMMLKRRDDFQMEPLSFGAIVWLARRCGHEFMFLPGGQAQFDRLTSYEPRADAGDGAVPQSAADAPHPPPLLAPDPPRTVVVICGPGPR